ncbi:hypothetical protein KLEB271_gp54 [Bacillus phage vB_BauS_KLEB27-1]|nr:hypothetical protein KLEB271_gp54 [Bacillus phage vB_BauS_KLEB27-1]
MRLTRSSALKRPSTQHLNHAKKNWNPTLMRFLNSVIYMFDDFLMYFSFVGSISTFIISGMYWSIVREERRNKGGE